MDMLTMQIQQARPSVQSRAHMPRKETACFVAKSSGVEVTKDAFDRDERDHLTSSRKSHDRPISILVLEDDACNRDIIEMFATHFFDKSNLPKSGIKVADSAETAMMIIDKMLSQDPKDHLDILFTDYNLGDHLNGCEFVKLMNEKYKANKLTCPSSVLVSGLSNISEEEKMLFWKILPKPFSYEQFSQVLASYIGSPSPQTAYR